MISKSVVLLCKENIWSSHAIDLAKCFFGESLTVFRGNFGDKFPIDLRTNNHNIIISFLSPWIIPEDILEKSEIAINFHPGTRNYPGYGCYNFALYEESRIYGCVCHHMGKKVDTGKIIFEETFKLNENETVESLKLRTMVTMLSLFHRTISMIAEERPLPIADINWSRSPFTRKELLELCEINMDMELDEIKKRIRAVTYPGYPGAELKIGGIKFVSEVPDRKPLA